MTDLKRLTAKELMLKLVREVTYHDSGDAWLEVRRRVERLEKCEAVLWKMTTGVEWQAAKEARAALEERWNCSTCDNPMFIVLLDRAFCERCYEVLQKQQRKLIEDFPYTTVIDQLSPIWSKDK